VSVTAAIVALLLAAALVIGTGVAALIERRKRARR
jgi:hypothetical protein